MSVNQAAKEYHSNGWAIIEVGYRSKRPVKKKWQKSPLSLKEIDLVFNGKPKNIGVIQGELSGGLVDVDLDSPESNQLAPHILPDTMIFGRKSKPRSHFIYQITSSELPKSTKYQVPSKTVSSYETLLELRSTGLHTVFPPSVHK